VKKPKDKSARAEKRGGEDQKSSRLKFSESEGGTAENAAEPSLKKKQPQPPPTAAGGEAKTVGAKFYQKKQYKDAYAAAKRGQKAGTAASKQAAAATNTITEKAKAASYLSYCKKRKRKASKIRMLKHCVCSSFLKSSSVKRMRSIGSAVLYSDIPRIVRNNFP
jgi:phage-related tail fiber protein